MNLFEKLNRLDDSLTESKRVVKKKKLTESVEDDKKKLFDAAASVKCKLDDDTIEYAMYDVDDFIETELTFVGNMLLEEHPEMLFWKYGDDSDNNFGGYFEVYASDDEHPDAYYQIVHDRLYDITDEINGDYDYDDDIDEMLTENRNNPYFAPYGYKDAAKVLNRKAPEYYYHLKEIEMDTGDGIKLAKYALRKGLPVMVDKNSDPDYPEFAIKGEYHWDDYFYPYPTAHEEDLVDWDGKMFVEEQLTEDSNSVSSQLPEDVDIFLQDLAQMYGMFDYKDIMNHKYTAEEIKKLRNYERRFNAEIEYEGDEEADAIMKDIAEKVAIVVKNSRLTEEQEDLVAGKVYTLKEDTFICDNDPTTIKNYLSNPDENSVKHVQQTYLKNEDIVIPRGTKLRYIKEVLIKSFYYDMYGDGKVVFLFSTEFKKHLN